MPYDAALDASGDLLLGSRFVRGPDLTVQRAGVRLGTWRGDILSNQFLGLPYREWLTTKPAPLRDMEAVVVAELEGTPGVLRATDIEAVFDIATQQVTVTGGARIQTAEQVDGLAAAFSLTVGGNSTSVVVSALSSGRAAPLPP